MKDTSTIPIAIGTVHQPRRENFYFKRGSWSIFTYQSYKLSDLTTFSLNGFVRFNGQFQFYELSTFGALNMSLAQTFFKKKLIVSVSCNDIFLSNNNSFTLQQASIYVDGMRKADTRRFGLTIRYNFGIRKKEEKSLLDVESPEKTN